jgi:hypothetical protein
LGLLLVTLLDKNQRTWIIICIIVAIGSCGPTSASFGVNHLDIGAHYAGILIALSSGTASTTGILVPILTGYVVDNPQVRNLLCCIWQIFVLVHIVVKKWMEYSIYYFDSNRDISFNILYMFCFR